jgi:tetratricopeptide (TPR) repeat protein
MRPVPPNITQPPPDLFHRALRAHRSARYPEAVELLQEYLRLSPDDANAHAQLAASLWALNQYDLALPHSQEALRLRPFP